VPFNHVFVADDGLFYPVDRVNGPETGGTAPPFGSRPVTL
jgi:hypothetical protein